MTEVPIIDQTISAVAPVLHRDTINPTVPATQDAFVNSAEAFFDKISEDTVDEINNLKDEMNDTVDAINIVSGEINTAAIEVEQAKEEVINIVATLPEGSIDNNTVSETTAWSSQNVVDTFAVTKDLIGFIERTTSTLSFTQNLFTLSTTGTIVYKHAKKYTISSNKTLDISSIVGGFYIAYNPETETLYNAGEVPSFTDDLLVAYIYRTSADIVIQADERHGAEIDTTWHTSHHLDTGAVWRAGGALTYTLDDDTNISLDVSTPLTIADEDLVHTILHNATPTQDYEQILSTNAKIPVMYIDNNIDFKYRQTVPSDSYPTWIKGGTRAVYNNATLGTLVEASEMNYITYWLVATNAMKTPVKLIMGRSEHTTEESAASETFEDYGLPMPEIVPMYKIILQTSSTFTGNNATVKIKSVYRLKQRESSLQNNLSPTAHNSLSGKDADNQHPMSAISGLEDAIVSKLDKDFSAFTDKTTPIDTDVFPIMEIGGLIKKLSWSNIKATLKTYFDTLYVKFLPTVMTGAVSFNAVTNEVSGTNIGVGVEIGDVILFSGATDTKNNNTFTIGMINNENSIIVNPYHANKGTSRNVATRVNDANVVVKLLAKWYNASDGLGQDWVNVIAGRALNTVYPNITNREIKLLINGTTTAQGGGAILTINGNLPVRINSYYGTGGASGTGEISISRNGTYSLAVNSFTVNTWYERV